MKGQKKEAKISDTTTIQVKKDLKDQLDLLKLMGNFVDLNALISELKEFYVENKKISISPKIDKFLKRIKK